MINPARMAWFDADQDGLADLVVLIPYEKIKILRQVPEAAFEELDVAPPGGTVEQPWLSAADVDGDGKPELLLAQKNFVRAVVLKPEANRADAKNWAFKVVDQINGAASNSRIVGAAPLRNDTNRVVAPLFLLDAERKALTFCERNTNGVWEVVRNLSLPFSEFTELQAVALGGRQPNSIAFLGLNAVAWMAFGGPTWELAELDGYETPILNGFLHDVIDLVHRPGLHQFVAGDAPDVEGHRSRVHLLLDVVAQAALALPGGDFNMGDELQVAAELPVVLMHVVTARLEDCIDPVLLGQGQRLDELLFRDVSPKQSADVLQVAAMHVTGNQVAAQQHPANLRRANRPERQRRAVAGRGWRRGWRIRRGCLGRPRRAEFGEGDGRGGSRGSLGRGAKEPTAVKRTKRQFLV